MADYYPPVAFHFLVNFDLKDTGAQEVAFQEVSGISAELEMETYKEGGENRFVHKLPNRTNYPDLVLKRGLLVNSAIRKWIELAIYNLEIQPIDVVVKILNEEHEPLQSYAFVNAYPKKWSISDLNAQSSSLVIESMELSYQYFNVKS